MPNFSHSKYSQYLRCQYAYFLKYEKNLIPIDTPEHLTLGTLIHAGIEGAIRKAHLGEDTDLVRGIRNTAHSFWGEGVGEEEQALEDKAIDIAHRAVEYLDLDKWETVHLNGEPLIESELKIPLKYRYWDNYIGYVDWVAREKSTGNLWVFDHKTRKSLKSYEMEETSPQFALYQYVLGELGLEISGTITFQILSDTPAVPKLNKDGTLSRRAIKTDWETYSAAIKAVGQNPAVYAEMRQKLAHNEFFRLTRNFRAPKEVQTIWDNTMQVAIDIATRTNYTRNLQPSFQCAHCEYKSLCLAGLRGEDTKYLEFTHFKEKNSTRKKLPIVSDGVAIDWEG